MHWQSAYPPEFHEKTGIVTYSKSKKLISKTLPRIVNLGVLNFYAKFSHIYLNSFSASAIPVRLLCKIFNLVLITQLAININTFQFDQLLTGLILEFKRKKSASSSN